MEWMVPLYLSFCSLRATQAGSEQARDELKQTSLAWIYLWSREFQLLGKKINGFDRILDNSYHIKSQHCLTQSFLLDILSLVFNLVIWNHYCPHLLNNWLVRHLAGLALVRGTAGAGHWGDDWAGIDLRKHT